MKKKISPKNRDYYESIVPEIDNLKKNGLINSYIGNKGYSIYKISLNDKIIEFIKKELTVKPFMQSSLVEPNSFPIYLESDKKIYVPRFWGINIFGNPKTLKIKMGKSIDLKFNGELRDYQKTVMDSYLKAIKFGSKEEENSEGSALIELGCGLGKTVLGLKIIQVIRKKTIIFVHKTFLKNQWIERIKQYLPDAKIGTIQGQIIDIEDKDIVIAMIQSISMKSYPDNLFDEFGFSCFDECFPSSTLIHTNKGKKKISMLYEIWEKYGLNNDIEILSFNTTKKKFEYKPLNYAWQKQSKNLIKFKLSKQIMECTINHKILTNKGYIEADKLNIGDIILCKYDLQHKDNLICPCLNDDQLQILYGSYLGDGCIQKTVKDRYRLRIIHCKEQKLYCEWKASMFGITELEYIEKNGYSQKEAYRFSSKCFDMDNSLANNKKEIPDWLINKIDERAIAIWFMDDGSLSKYTLKDGSVSCYATLHSNNFDNDNHLKLLNLFKKYNIECIISKSNKYNYLRFDNKNTKALLNLIRKYIHSNFEYKIDFISDNQYNWNNEFLKYGSLKITKKEYIKKLRDINVYDIEVKDNHNFIIATGSKDTNYIDGPIVSNCHHISSETFSNCLRKCTTLYGLGLSATMNRKDGLTRVFKMYLGDICNKQKNKVEEDNVLVKVIDYVVLDDDEYNEVERDFRGNVKHTTMLSKVSNFNYRTDFIVNVIENELKINKEQQIILLGHQKNLLNYIYKAVELKNLTNVGYYIGGMKEKDLKVSESKQLILATYAMAAEGLDIPSLTTLILATPKSDIVQSVGRILREKHSNPLIIDIIDQHDCFINQFAKRKAFYNEKNYKIIRTNNERYIDYIKYIKKGEKFDEEEIWKEVVVKSKKTKENKCLIKI
jgi:superfamily II DNA or RNA helicase